MKKFLPLLTLLMLSACQPPVQLPPQNSFGAGATAESECAPYSSEVNFNVYNNAQNVDFSYPGVKQDKSRPVNQPRFEINGAPAGTVNGNRISVKRIQGEMKISITAAGFDSISDTYQSTDFPQVLCGNYYVALSPLSAEESQGEAQSLTHLFLGHNLKLNSDSSSGLEYAVIPNLEAFEALVPLITASRFRSLDTTKIIDEMRAGLKAGKAWVLLSNGSQGLGDLFDLVHRVTKLGSKTILASHLNTLERDPQPMYPYGDRFSSQIEAILIPGETQTLVLDLLKAGAGAGNKTRLEIPVAKAALPEQASAKSNEM